MLGPSKINLFQKQITTGEIFVPCRSEPLWQAWELLASSGANEPFLSRFFSSVKLARLSSLQVLSLSQAVVEHAGRNVTGICASLSAFFGAAKNGYLPDQAYWVAMLVVCTYKSLATSVLVYLPEALNTAKSSLSSDETSKLIIDMVAAAGPDLPEAFSILPAALRAQFKPREIIRLVKLVKEKHSENSAQMYAQIKTTLEHNPHSVSLCALRRQLDI